MITFLITLLTLGFGLALTHLFVPNYINYAAALATVKTLLCSILGAFGIIGNTSSERRQTASDKVKANPIATAFGVAKFVLNIVQWVGLIIALASLYAMWWIASNYMG